MSHKGGGGAFGVLLRETKLDRGVATIRQEHNAGNEVSFSGLACTRRAELPPLAAIRLRNFPFNAPDGN